MESPETAEVKTTGSVEATPASGALAVIESSPPGIRDILSSVINISSDGMYYEPSCPFCASKHRQDAERLWAGFDIGVRNPEEKVTSFFDSVGEKIPFDMVRNHLVTHMNKGDSEIRKLEYVSRIASLSSNQMTSVEQVKIATAAVLECLASVGAMVPTKGLSQSKVLEIKSAAVTKLVKTWTDLLVIQAKMTGELWDKGEMVAIPSSDFYKIFDETLNSAKTPDERKLIAAVLDGLTKATQRG